VLALLCVGEIGRRTDLSAHVGLEGSVTECFASPSEEVKGASAHALGSITVGNLARYLPYVLAQINGCEPKLQYHLLFALKEVITTPHHADQTHVAVVIPPDLTEQIMALLLLHSESSEEGVRNVVADCLGKLALRRPVDSLPILAQRLSAPNPSMRATMVMALKFTMSDRPQLELDAALPAFLPRFLALIEDPDRHVRRAAVQALQVGCHHKAPLLLPLLPSLLPLLYQQTIVRPELVRTVDLGPFKHIVDDGLELRKSAFECMETLLDHCLGRIDTHAFLLVSAWRLPPGADFM
jgi:cullin-associated NEDD8-dissociated protein 1